MFKLGDKVRVINSEYCYTTYSYMAEVMELEKWIHGDRVPDNIECKIISKSHHQVNNILLYGVESNGHQYIIQEDGLEYCSSCGADLNEGD